MTTTTNNKINQTNPKNQKESYSAIVDEVMSQIGESLISQNDMLVREYFLWMDIFNSYKKKLPMFNQYMQGKNQEVIAEIYQVFETIKGKIVNTRIKCDDKLFIRKLKKAVSSSSSNRDFTDISKI